MMNMPTTFGEFKVDGFLGEGGMSYVWRATHPVLGKVALKELKATYLSGMYVEQFTNEVKMIRSLEHPSIVQIDYFESQSKERGTPFFVMKVMEGTLGDERHPIRRPPKECLALLRPIAEALDHAHEDKPPDKQRIIHCDVKPSNILFDEKGKPRLSDFGIARWEFSPFVPSAAADDPVDLGLTEIHPHFAGTLEYAAPELIDGTSDPTTASDIYSLAVVAYEILTGDRPFTIEQAAEGGDGSQRARLEAWRELHSGRKPDQPYFAHHDPAGRLFHRHYQKVFRTALHKNAGERYQTATAFIDALEKAWLLGPQGMMITLGELPGLLLGRSGEGSAGAASAEAYRHMRRRGAVAAAVWLVVTLLVVGLWRAGGLGELRPVIQSRTWSDLWNESGLSVVAARLLAQWWYVGLAALLSLVYLACRLLGRVAERADYDRYWHAENAEELTKRLLMILNEAYKQKKVDGPKDKSPKIDEFYRRVGIVPREYFPETLHHKIRKKECDKLVELCKQQRRLFRLQAAVRQENADIQKEGPIILKRSLSRRLRRLGRGAWVLCLAVVGLAGLAVFYWHREPQATLAAPAVVGVVLLWGAGLVAIRWTLPR